MYTGGRAILMIVSTFLLGFGLGGTSLYYAQAQGLFGLSGSVQQIGSTLTDMKKNVDALQQNMASFTKVKEQLTALASTSSKPAVKQGEESLKQMIPGFGQ